MVPVVGRGASQCSIFLVSLLLSGAGCVNPGAGSAQSSASECTRTRADSEGPFYKPNAPARAQTGRGMQVSGRVRSALDCKPLAGARIEWWSADGGGNYTDDLRATVLSDKGGAYRYETTVPSGYFFRPPHLHVKVSAPRHRTLTTQIYPEEGQQQIVFDFNLAGE